ncbi:MAG: D-2-hydroxyacid dehydrogenase [Clostridia bacterium]|nr:D-2-hydroxyacid dehydrogenase [Clostridia bacterium]
MTKIAVLPPFPQDTVKRFSDIAGAEFVYGDALDAEVIFGQPSPETILSLPRLKWVQSASAGVDGYVKRRDVFERGVILTTASGAFGQSISEWTLAMVLSLYKHLNVFRDNQKNALWRDAGRQYSPRGKNLLILGMGDIGCSIERIFRPFGCRVTGVRRKASLLPEGFERAVTLSGIDDVLPNADIIACALPGTGDTQQVFDARRLALLKREAVLVNVGRGSLIDCAALAEALNAGRIYGAALDVTDPEPLPEDHPLWRCENAIISPHASGGSFGHLRATEETIIDICRKNLCRYLKNEPLLNRVDFDTGYRSINERYAR